MDCIRPGSSVHGISQARILEWVAMLSSRGIFLTQGSNIWKFIKQHRFCTKTSFKIKYLWHIKGKKRSFCGKGAGSCKFFFNFKNKNYTVKCVNFKGMAWWSFTNEHYLVNTTQTKRTFLALQKVPFSSQYLLKSNQHRLAFPVPESHVTGIM